MTTRNPATITRKIVLISVLTLFLVWISAHFSLLTSTQNGFIRFFLTLFFGVLILTRRKPEKEPSPVYPLLTAAAALFGLFIALAGTIFEVGQMEWVGLLLILVAGLQWALPRSYARDALLAAFLLYWAHPIPSRIFAPLQVFLQRLSVEGSEWLLHVLNFRVWADGLVLRTGKTIYEIPQWCSGMRTATTVFLVGFGLGLLKRLHWSRIVCLVALGVAQALLLNVLRISFVVMLSTGSSAERAQELLHDTSGIIVAAAIVLLYLEILLWERHKRLRDVQKEELNPEQMKALSEYPPFWRRLLEYKWRILAGMAVLLLSGVAGYKSRAYHRAEMIKDVVFILRDSGEMEAAERAARVVRDMVPNDVEWEYALVRIMVLRGRFQEALGAIEDLPASANPGEKQVLKAYCLMGMRETDAARKIVEELPSYYRRDDPRLAMVLSELAFFRNDPEQVVKHLKDASKWAPNITRIRALYPYLRAHRKWSTIISTDIPIPHTLPATALSATEANMHMGNTPLVAQQTLQAIKRWPEDPRLLEPLFFMALKRQEGEWMDRFADHLGRTVRVMTNIDELFELFDKCFRLVRPDLAWLVYRRIERLDPTHPALAMSVVRHGHEWFSFRQRFLGIGSPFEDARIDVRPLYYAGLQLNSWRPWSLIIPLADELATENTLSIRKRYLETALKEFKARRTPGTEHPLTVRMRHEYALALEIHGDIERAAQELEAIEEEYPEKRNDVSIFLSELYERAADWQSVYETLRTYPVAEDARLEPLLRLCAAERYLEMGIAALQTAQKSVELFPRSAHAAVLRADTLLRYDSPEQALWMLENSHARHIRELDLLEALVLTETQRFSAAQAFHQSALIPGYSVDQETRQELFLPPAELTLLWHHVYLPSRQAFEKNAARLRENLATATSPFLREMIEQWLACYKADCAGDTANIGTWEGLGRDNVEKAVALNQLTLLLCKAGKFQEASRAALGAATLLPESPILWRIAVSLSHGDTTVLARARAACPADPEIWLAWLVAATHPSISSPNASEAREPISRIDETAVAESISKAAQKKTFSAAAMTRAAEYLYRGGMRSIAATAMRDATTRARSLLPAYVMGIRCAIHEQDPDWALQCTRNAIAASLRPRPEFYEKLVELRMRQDEIPLDSGMIEALRNLRRAKPDNPLWAQMLGYIRYRRGGWEIIDALYQMSSALEHGSTNRIAYVVAAEAARFAGNIERSLDLLRQGLSLHPNDLILRNNLAYTLTLTPGGVEESLEMLPGLLKDGGKENFVLDTAAEVYLRAGRLSDAEPLISEILSRAEEGTPAWFRARRHLAEIEFRRGKAEEAEIILQEALRKGRDVPDEDMLKANELLTQCESARSEEERNQPDAESPPIPDTPEK